MNELHWHALRAEPKREHIAAANLRACEVESFSPRMTYGKPMQRRGVVPVTEALFPCYLFARFDMAQLDVVKRTRGVVGVVKFGDFMPPIPDNQIERLREAMGGEVARVAMQFTPGQVVDVRTGIFAGAQGTVLSAIPSRDRLKLLLTVLGSPCEVEVSLASVFTTPKLQQLAA